MLSQGDGCGDEVRGKWQQTRQTYDKSSLSSKIYTTWARILSARSTFYTLREGKTTGGLRPLGLFVFKFQILGVTFLVFTPVFFSVVMQAVLCYSSTILLPLVVIVTFLLLESFSVRLAEEERLCLLKYCLKYTLSFPTVASALLFYRICFVLFFFSFFFWLIGPFATGSRTFILLRWSKQSWLFSEFYTLSQTKLRLGYRVAINFCGF